MKDRNTFGKFFRRDPAALSPMRVPTQKSEAQKIFAEGEP